MWQLWGTYIRVLESFPKAPLSCQEHVLQACQTSSRAAASGHSGALTVWQDGA